MFTGQHHRGKGCRQTPDVHCQLDKEQVWIFFNGLCLYCGQSQISVWAKLD